MADEKLVVLPTAEEIDNLRGYRIGTWKQSKNYECIYCQYSTLWKSKMEKHQAENDHPWAYPGQNPKVVGDVEDDDPRY